MLMICYERCSTCKKALEWLKTNGYNPQVRDIKLQNPSYEELAEWVEASGLAVERFFNTSGILYREGKVKDRLSTMSYAEKLKLLSTDGMLVKRPIVIKDNKVLVGFNETKWADTLL